MHYEETSGPLPSAAELGRYDEVLPGLASRIVELTEREQSHRHDMEHAVVKAEIRNASRGQLCGFAIVFIVLFAGIGFLAAGHTIAGLVATLVPLAVLVGVFVSGKAPTMGAIHLGGGGDG